MRKGLAQESDLVTEFFEQVTQVFRHVIIEQELHSEARAIFPPVVFIVGQALVDLGSGELREAVHRQGVDCFAVLEEADDIVDADSGAFHDRVATAHPCRADAIAVGFRGRFHALMLRFAYPSVNADHVARCGPERFGGERDGRIETLMLCYCSGARRLPVDVLRHRLRLGQLRLAIQREHERGVFGPEAPKMAEGRIIAMLP